MLLEERAAATYLSHLAARSFCWARLGWLLVWMLLCASRWRSRLRETKPAATLHRVAGVMPDLERGLGRAVPRSPFTKRKHGCGAPADGAILRAALAEIFGKANVSASCR